MDKVKEIVQWFKKADAHIRLFLICNLFSMSNPVEKRFYQTCLIETTSIEFQDMKIREKVANDYNMLPGVYKNSMIMSDSNARYSAIVFMTLLRPDNYKCATWIFENLICNESMEWIITRIQLTPSTTDKDLELEVLTLLVVVAYHPAFLYQQKKHCFDILLQLIPELPDTVESEVGQSNLKIITPGAECFLPSELVDIQSLEGSTPRELSPEPELTNTEDSEDKSLTQSLPAEGQGVTQASLSPPLPFQPSGRKLRRTITDKLSAPKQSRSTGALEQISESGPQQQTPVPSSTGAIPKSSRYKVKQQALEPYTLGATSKSPEPSPQQHLLEKYTSARAIVKMPETEAQQQAQVPSSTGAIPKSSRYKVQQQALEPYTLGATSKSPEPSPQQHPLVKSTLARAIANFFETEAQQQTPVPSLTGTIPKSSRYKVQQQAPEPQTSGATSKSPESTTQQQPPEISTSARAIIKISETDSQHQVPVPSSTCAIPMSSRYKVQQQALEPYTLGATSKSPNPSPEQHPPKIFMSARAIVKMLKNDSQQQQAPKPRTSDAKSKCAKSTTQQQPPDKSTSAGALTKVTAIESQQAQVSSSTGAIDKSLGSNVQQQAKLPPPTSTNTISDVQQQACRSTSVISQVSRSSVEQQVPVPSKSTGAIPKVRQYKNSKN